MPSSPKLDEKNEGPLLRRTKSGAPSSLVKVVVRLRPVQTGEGKECVKADSGSIVRVIDPVERNAPAMGFSRTAAYAIDHAYAPSAPTSDIYQDSVQRLGRAAVREGKNACCFAYGATGSGKTFTMQGSAVEGGAPAPGVIGLALRDLFAWADASATISASYFQIYLENVTDLLTQADGDDEPPRESPAPPTELAVRMDAEGRTHVVGAREIVVTSEAELTQLIERGNKNRTTAATDCNDASSRSHAILQLCVSQPGRAMTSKLSLIDLAGSSARRAQTRRASA